MLLRKGRILGFLTEFFAFDANICAVALCKNLCLFIGKCTQMQQYRQFFAGIQRLLAQKNVGSTSHCHAFCNFTREGNPDNTATAFQRYSAANFFFAVKNFKSVAFGEGDSAFHSAFHHFSNGNTYVILHRRENYSVVFSVKVVACRQVSPVVGFAKRFVHIIIAFETVGKKLGIHGGGNACVFGTAVSPFYFECGNTAFQKLFGSLQTAVIARGKQICPFCKPSDVGLVQFSARLCAQTTVSAVSAHHGGKQALPRLTNAQRSVQKTFGIYTALTDTAYFFQGAFPCNHYRCCPEFFQKSCAEVVVSVQLGACDYLKRFWQSCGKFQ